jgi:hypothetical protein
MYYSGAFICNFEILTCVKLYFPENVDENPLKINHVNDLKTEGQRPLGRPRRRWATILKWILERQDGM